MSRFSQTTDDHSRHGYTLMELVVASAASAILLAGMMSTVGIALKASDTSIGPATDTRNGHTAVTTLSAELQFATTVIEKTATSITVTVPDQNFDMADETIRYAWAGSPGDPLTRQYNGGIISTLSGSLHDFEIEYIPTVGAVTLLNVRLQAGSDSATTVQASIPLVNEP